MKKTIIALAVLMMGAASLSTANAMPASSIGEAVKAETGLQLTGGHFKHRHFRRRHFHNRYYRRHFDWYPSGYYNGFCYAHPYNHWCRRYFFRNYY